MAALLREEEEQEIRETCALFDTDQTGKLSRDDNAKVVRSTGSNPTEKELLDMFQSIDADGMEGSGQVDINEFIQYYGRKLYDPMKKEEQDANEAFRTFDANGEGAIELHDLKNIMTSLGEDTFSDVEFRQEIMKEIYTGSDGKMNYTDFTKMMNEKC